MNFKLWVAVVMMITLSLLGGCGGGGSGSGTAEAPAMKGIWSGTAGATSTSAIVLANGDAWVVSADATSFKLAVLPLSLTGTAFSGSGKQYQDTSSETATVSGTFAQKASVTGSMIATSGTSSFSLTYDSRYDTPVTVADAVGTWTATYSTGTVNLPLTIAATGNLVGHSTTGCDYAGTILPRPEDPAIFNVNFTETCLTGTPSALSGIATLNEAKTRLSIAVTSVDKSTGTLYVGVKQ